MSPETAHLPQNFEIRSSVLNMLERSTLWSVVLPLRRLQNINVASGYSGFEWHPLSIATVAGLQVRRDTMNDTEKSAIRSLHQSFRTERTPVDVLRSGRPVFSMASVILLEQSKTSIQSLINLQNRLNHPLQLILYPDPYTTLHADRVPFSELLVQPKPSDMRVFGASSPGDYLGKLKNRSYGICLDTHHMRESDRTNGKPDFLPWESFFPYLLQYAREIHIAAGRWDRSYTGVDTHQELLDLLSGTGNSPLMRMLRIIQSSGWKGPIVTEIPASAFRFLHPETHFIMPETYIGYHKRIVQTIGSIVG